MFALIRLRKNAPQDMLVAGMGRGFCKAEHNRIDVGRAFHSRLLDKEFATNAACEVVARMLVMNAASHMSCQSLHPFAMLCRHM